MQWVDPPGARLAYHDLPGRDPVCVFLHGLGASSSADFTEISGLRPLLPYRRLLVDFLGFGFSDRPQGFSYTLDDHAQSIICLLKHLGLSHRLCVIIGHSMGGAVAITLAATAETRFAGIVVAEGNLDPGGGIVSRPVSEQTEEAFLKGGYDRFRQVLAAHPHTEPYAASVRVAAPLALYRSAVSLKEGTVPSMRDRLASLPLPRTFVFGEKSLPDPDETWLAQQGVTVDVIPSAGHNMMHENPAAFADVVAQAVKRSDVGACS